MSLSPYEMVALSNAKWIFLWTDSFSLPLPVSIVPVLISTVSPLSHLFTIIPKFLSTFCHFKLCSWFLFLFCFLLGYNTNFCMINLHFFFHMFNSSWKDPFFGGGGHKQESVADINQRVAINLSWPLTIIIFAFCNYMLILNC